MEVSFRSQCRVWSESGLRSFCVKSKSWPMVLIRDIGVLDQGLASGQNQDFLRSKSTVSWPGSEVRHCSGSGQHWEWVSGEDQIPDSCYRKMTGLWSVLVDGYLFIQHLLVTFYTPAINKWETGPAVIQFTEQQSKLDHNWSVWENDLGSYMEFKLWSALGGSLGQN